jgi:hypothetical protein
MVSYEIEEILIRNGGTVEKKYLGLIREDKKLLWWKWVEDIGYMTNENHGSFELWTKVHHASQYAVSNDKDKLKSKLELYCQIANSDKEFIRG